MPYWQGLNKDKDPGAIADVELQDAINVRLNAGRIDCRGGQEKLTEQALDGCVWSIDDLPLPVTGFFLTVLSSSTNIIDRYNVDFVPNYSTVYSDVTLPVQLGTGSLVNWNSRLLTSTSAGLYEVVLPKNSVSGEVSIRLFVVLSFNPTSFAIVPEGAVDTLYIGAPAGEVVRYDGTWLSTDGAVGTGTQIVGRFHGQLHSCGSTTLLQRKPGAPLVNGLPAPGTYSTYALSITPFLASRLTEWKQTLFIVGQQTGANIGHILAFDGTTVTTAHSPTAALSARNVSDAIVWNDKLWYVWRELGADPHTWIGNYDGVTWSDQIADLGGTQTGSALTGWFCLANGLLYVTTIRDEVGIGGGGTNAHVLMSSDDGTTWTLVQDISKRTGATGSTPPYPVVFA
jgi:hypothetical protein